VQRGKSRLPYLIITIVVMLISDALIIQPPLFVQFLENKTFDFRFLLRGERSVGNEIIIVGIDEQSIANIGRWPWPRAKIAELIEKVASGGARTIGVDILFSEPEADPGKSMVRDILKEYQRGHRNDIGFLSYLKKKERDPGGDSKLAQAMRDAGNVILPFAMQVPLSTDNNVKILDIPEAVFFYPFMVVKEKSFKRPIVANGVLLPINELQDAAWSLGSVYTQYDKDGAIRWEPLSIQLEQYYFPSFGLEIARHYLGLKRQDVQLVVGEGIVMGENVISTDASGRVLINYAGKSHTFPIISALQILQGNVPESALRDKLVLIGATALGTSDTHITPFAQLAGVEKQASVIENIIHQNFFTKEELIKILNCAFILLFCLVAVIYLPRLKAYGGALLTAAFTFVYLLVTQYLFLVYRWWVDMLVPVGTVFVLYSLMTTYRFLTEELRAREIKAMFSSYTTEKVVNELLEHPELAVLGGLHRNVTVMFSDVRSFTTFCEARTPEEVIASLNELLSAMTEVIFAWDGTLDKFVGDEIMAFWGAPALQDKHAAMAFCCSLAMMDKMVDMKAQWLDRGLEPLEIGVGLNTGAVVVGNIGCEGKKMDYTIIGDAVNLGARVEALTRSYHDYIIITDFTYEKVRPYLTSGEGGLFSISMPQGSFSSIHIKPLESVKVKGKDQSVMIYEVALDSWGAAP